MIASIAGVASVHPQLVQAQGNDEQRRALSAKPSVVRVYGGYLGRYRLGGNEFPVEIGGVGSGFFISADGYIATNAHVIDAVQGREETAKRKLADALRATLSHQYNSYAVQELLYSVELVELKRVAYVVLSNGDKLDYQLVASGVPGKGNDCAIIKVQIENAPAIAIADSAGVLEADPVTVIGYPGVADMRSVLDEKSALEPTITSGTISALKHADSGESILQISAVIAHGSSGGPAVDQNGAVIGLVTFGAVDEEQRINVQGFNFLVASSTLLALVKQSGVVLKPSETTALWQQALASYWNQDYDDTVRKLEEVERLFPQHVDAQHLLARTLQLKHDGKGRGGNSDASTRSGAAKWVALGAGASLGIVGTAWLLLRKRRNSTRTLTTTDVPSYVQEESRPNGRKPQALIVDEVPEPPPSRSGLEAAAPAVQLRSASATRRLAAHRGLAIVCVMATIALVVAFQLAWRHRGSRSTSLASQTKASPSTLPTVSSCPNQSQLKSLVARAWKLEPTRIEGEILCAPGKFPAGGWVVYTSLTGIDHGYFERLGVITADGQPLLALDTGVHSVARTSISGLVSADLDNDGIDEIVATVEEGGKYTPDTKSVKVLAVRGSAFVELLHRGFGYTTNVDTEMDRGNDNAQPQKLCDGNFEITSGRTLVIHGRILASLLKYKEQKPGCVDGTETYVSDANGRLRLESAAHGSGETVTGRPPAGMTPPAAPRSMPAKPASINVSSTHAPGAGYTFAAANLIDGNLATSWQPHDSNGPASVRLLFADDITVTSVKVANGFQTFDNLGDEFMLNSRIAKARMQFSDGTEMPIQIAPDARGFVEFNIPSKVTRSVTLLVDDVHHGTRWNDLAICEIEIDALDGGEGNHAAAPAMPQSTRAIPPAEPASTAAKVTCHNWFNMSPAEQDETARAIGAQVRSDYQQKHNRTIDEFRSGDYVAFANAFTALCKGGGTEDMYTLGMITAETAYAAP